tara:strand:- start:4435 stop:5004 length:570 start_codon:yes stop_codon:yes gene_type:complete
MTKPPTLPDNQAREALAERLTRPLVLVGMMGVGKSSVGRRLAAALDFQFFDADEEIEQAAQMGVPEIFNQFGEAYFRDGERRVIERLLDHEKAVIATGGGAFVQAQTAQMILDRGIAIWLDADLETLLERVTRNDNRPLLRGGDKRAILARLKTEREPSYARAPIKVKSGKGPHGEVVARILEALEQWQ